jgi:hypothetical protein
MFLRYLILAFTGDRAASVLEEPGDEIKSSSAAATMQVLDQLGAGWQLVLLPVTLYEVIRGTEI